MNEQIIISGKSEIKGVVFFHLLSLVICIFGFFFFITTPLYIAFIPLVFLTIISFVNSIYLKNNVIVVTKETVSGFSALGRRLDLPLSQISGVFVNPSSKEIAVSTSSGLIRFSHIPNYDAIYKVIGQLLSQKNDSSVTNNQKNDNLDDLKKLKDLLDSGIITKKEFEEKKKKILDL